MTALKLFVFMIPATCMLISQPSFADGSDEKSVDININASTAQTVENHPADSRFGKLRNQADSQASKSAAEKGKSYVAMAPDPHNKSYWMEKNGDTSTAASNTENKSTENEATIARDAAAMQPLLARFDNKADPGVTITSFGAADINEITAGSNASAHIKQAIALPGTLWYATMDSGADSYVPGPVVAEIEQGPLAGGKAIGKFEIAPDGEHLILTFDTIAFGNKSYAISAVAMDASTKISGVTGNIDHHFMTRFIIPGAANFLSKVTDALMNQSQSVVTNPSGIVVTGPHLSNTQLALIGAGGATRAFSDATRPEGVLRLPEVKLKPGQGLGFLLLKPVLAANAG